MVIDVLAAGTALGQVGEWEGAIDYLRNSYTASQLGQVSHVASSDSWNLFLSFSFEMSYNSI